jgi:WD40 repeat protein
MLTPYRIGIVLAGLAALPVSAARADDKDDKPLLEVVRTLKGPKGLVNFIALSPDGKSMAAVARGDATIFVWDVESGEERAKIKLQAKAMTTNLAFADGKSIAYDDGTAGVVRVFEIESGKELRKFTYNPRGNSGHHTYGSAFSPGMKMYAFANIVSSQGIELWDAKAGKRVGGLALPMPNSVTFSADGKMIAGQDCYGHIRLWDDKGKAIRELNRENKLKLPVAVTMLVFAPDGKTIAAAGQLDEVITVWEVKTGKVLHSLTLPQNQEVTALVFSADGKWVGGSYVRGTKETLQFWEVATGKEGIHIEEERTSGFPEKAVLFSPSAALLTGGGMDQVRLYGPRKGREKDVPLFVPMEGIEKKPEK